VALLLKEAGIPNVLALVGGYEEWVRRGEPVERGGRE
jgi:rhodanese-related sulfurtransferase